MLFDKTGTITDGRMSVVDIAAAPGFSEHDVMEAAASLERASEHPVGRAIVRAATAAQIELEEVQEFAALVGAGARGIVAGHAVSVGSFRDVAGPESAAVSKALQTLCTGWLDDARTVVIVCQDARVIGAVALSDTVRPSARRAVSHLQRLGLRCVLVTGDNEHAARSSPRSADSTTSCPESPRNKRCRSWRGSKPRGISVAMVGDGINDGPALSRPISGWPSVRAPTSLAILPTSWSSVTISARCRPPSRLARRTHRTIRRNLAWAFGYNLVAIPLAACGLLDLSLPRPPWRFRRASWSGAALVSVTSPTRPPRLGEVAVR